MSSLLVTDPQDDLRRLTFTHGTVSFGRHKRADVRFTDPRTSERHAEVRQIGERWVLRDVGSEQGTWIGGAFLAEDRAIREPLWVEFGRGGPMLRLETVESAPTTTPGGRSRRGTTAYVQALVALALRGPQRRMRVLVAVALLTLVVSTVVIILVIGVRGSNDAREIVARNQGSLFMLIADDGGHMTGFCTAFAVTADGGLATNAHCVRRIADLRASGARVLARMNRAPERTYEVVRWKIHPGYRDTPLSMDVGLVAIDLGDTRLDVVTVMAAPADLSELAPGQTVYTLGFPGEVMNEAAPEADFRSATISRLTTPDNEPGDERSARIVWHSALTSHGTSGSPIFDAAGRAIAVASGGLSGKELVVAGPGGKLQRQFITEANGLNFGIRIDAVRELLGDAR